ncbi:DUF3995 domain-containing protein [Streptomyces palmae]|uniref:DUF3995 domain-containing protein n=1 Tax=Streptomyces palmae TaxID=1701085 RepID=A0A4Z0FUZ2_9ACTN|nr:DUF3995 domain-containing protein [Streptomyces palmae]TGA86981.1 DUF3995 domain-containing protein [Streptomyces palmae]
MDTRIGKWAGYAVGVWGLLFAIPSFIWAMGGTFGAESTVSPDLVEMAEDRVTWFMIVLWVTAFLKLFGSVIGMGLTRLRGLWTSRMLVFCGSGAMALLVWHGGYFVIYGVLVKAGVRTVEPDLTPLIDWYLFLWGPYFVIGGVAFALAVLGYVRRADVPRDLRRYGYVATSGAVLLSLASTLTGIG